jgi:truncated hemoglobin YjbI
VTPEKRLEIACEAFVLKRVLEVMPPEFPNLRELRIQNEKLSRIVYKHRRVGDRTALAAGLRALAGASDKKERKRQGEHDARVGRQRMKVKSLATQSFKEWLRQRKPVTNAEFRDWKRKFDEGMAESVKRTQKQITDTVVSQLAQNLTFGSRRKS